MTRNDHPSSPPRRRFGVGGMVAVAVAAGLVTVLVVGLADRFPEAVDQEGERMAVAYRVLLAVLMGTALVAHGWAAPGTAVRHAALWLGVGVVLFVGYSFRDEAGRLADRLMGELLPHRGRVEGTALVLRARRDGHFVVEAQVDGVAVRFLVDSGASDVVLSPEDARRIGFDLGALRFTRLYDTANGTVRGAPVRLNRVAVGPIAIADVRASVNEAALSQSLLGMSFLGRLGGWDVRGDRLTLRP